MPETLRDLVVSLSLQSDNFTRNIRSVNKQIQEAESFFKLAAAGVENFEQSTAGLDSRLTTLQQKLSLQREVVDQYQRALQAARDKLQECYDRQGDYANRLADARNTQARLNTLVAEAAAAYADCKARLGESDQATIEAATHLKDLRSTYQDTTEEVRKLAGQCEALQRATQNAADAVSTGNSNLNKASAAVKQTEADIDKTNQALALSQTNWRSAGESIKASENALVSIGKQMQSADATFRLLTVDIKDVDSSTEGLSAKMVLLEERLQLQNRAVQEYQNILRATREQQAAAQSVNDVDMIRQTTDAVTDAETALTRAQTAVRETEQAINACNTQLTLANSGWFAAAESIRGSESAIAGIANQLRLAESEFNLTTAGMQNVDTTVAGLTARSNMLTQQLNLQNQAVAEYANILGQAIDTLVHVLDACRGSLERALGHLDLTTDSSDGVLRVGDGLSSRIPVSFRKPQGIAALDDLVLCLGKRSTGVVERRLRFGDCTVRLPDLVRIAGCLCCRQLLLSGLQSRLILSDRVLLELPFLTEHIHLR